MCHCEDSNVFYVRVLPLELCTAFGMVKHVNINYDMQKNKHSVL